MDGRNDSGRDPSNPGGDAPSQRELENDVAAAIMRWAAGKRFLRLARFNVGLFLTVDMNRPIQVGVKGCADYLGILKPSGRVIAVETKHPRTGRQSVEQRAFQRTIEAFGGIYVIARSVKDVEDAIKDYIQ